jgi:CubicO group peptidase (beta-lactamase class C family)
MLPWRPIAVSAVVSILLVSAAPSTIAEDVIASRARGLLERTVREDGPGAVFLVGRGDTIVYSGTRGRGHIELGVPLQTGHVCRIASITKMFVAASVLKLAESGALSLDVPVARRLPEMGEARGMTARQLLNHTAGVSDTASSRSGRSLPAGTIGSPVLRRSASAQSTFHPGPAGGTPTPATSCSVRWWSGSRAHPGI